MITATALLIIGTFTSQPGESMDQFVTRVAPEAVAYTDEHNVEVCGAIGQDGPEMTLVLTTDGNAMECKVSKVRGKFTGFIFTLTRARVTKVGLTQTLRYRATSPPHASCCGRTRTKCASWRTTSS